MKLTDTIKNSFLYSNKYKTHSEAVIIACYFNPQNNPYRLKAFNIFYESIKHLNHRIVECVIGDTKPQLEESENISRITTPNLLWHKESILNMIVKNLPAKYKYVFWVDADVIFTNNNWLVDSVKSLQENNICQPFEYCIHLKKDQTEPHFDVTHEYEHVNNPRTRHPEMWRSFCANDTIGISSDENYDKHGHVGFAWGARREVLDSVPLYDRALIGGGDHIIAHAAAGHINHSCIMKSFTEDIDAVNDWSRKFHNVVKGKIGYAKGDLYHIWHGDLENRQYLKRIQEYTPTTKSIIEKDENGLHITKNGDDAYVKKYFETREVKTVANKDNTSKAVYYQKRAELQIQYPDRDDSFIDSIIWGYITDSMMMGTMMGGNPIGALVGEMLADGIQNNQNDMSGGGGQFGGAGSGGSWSDDNTIQDQPVNNPTDSTQVDDAIIISNNFS